MQRIIINAGNKTYPHSKRKAIDTHGQCSKQKSTHSKCSNYIDPNNPHYFHVRMLAHHCQSISTIEHPIFDGSGIVHHWLFCLSLFYVFFLTFSGDYHLQYTVSLHFSQTKDHYFIFPQPSFIKLFYIAKLGF